MREDNSDLIFPPDAFRVKIKGEIVGIEEGECFHQALNRIFDMRGIDIRITKASKKSHKEVVL